MDRSEDSEETAASHRAGTPQGIVRRVATDVDSSKGESNHRWSWRNPASYAAVAAIVAACFTGGTLVVNYRSMVATQRAWLTIDAVNEVQLVANQPIRVTIDLGNSGKSPAYNLRPMTSIRVTSAIPPGLPNYSEASRGRAVIGPGKSRPVFLDLTAPFSKDNFDSVMSGAQTLYFWILVEYDHPFGRGGVEVCMEYLPTLSGVTFCGGDSNRVW